jgi:hypothetical protein
VIYINEALLAAGLEAVACFWQPLLLLGRRESHMQADCKAHDTPTRFASSLQNYCEL